MVRRRAGGPGGWGENDGRHVGVRLDTVTGMLGVMVVAVIADIVVIKVIMVVEVVKVTVIVGTVVSVGVVPGMTWVAVMVTILPLPVPPLQPHLSLHPPLHQ